MDEQQRAANAVCVRLWPNVNEYGASTLIAIPISGSDIDFGCRRHHGGRPVMVTETTVLWPLSELAIHLPMHSATQCHSRTVQKQADMDEMGIPSNM